MIITCFDVHYRYRAHGRPDGRWQYYAGRIELAGTRTREEARVWIKRHGLTAEAEVLYLSHPIGGYDNGGRWLWTDRVRLEDLKDLRPPEPPGCTCGYAHGAAPEPLCTYCKEGVKNV